MGIKRQFLCGMLIVVACSLVATTGAAASVPRDLVGHWAEPEMCRLIAHDIVAQNSAGLVRPDQFISRGELVQVLIRSLGYRDDARALARAPRTFSDVGIMHPYRGDVEAAVELGIARGYPDGTFRPELLVTRAELAAFVVRALGRNDEAESWTGMLPFTDSRLIPLWSRGYVGVVADFGLILGFGDGSYGPAGNATRAQVGVVVARMMELKGTLWSVSGTVTGVPAFGYINLRLKDGRVMPFMLASEVFWFRNDRACRDRDILAGDQARVIVGPDGQVRYVSGLWLDGIGRLEATSLQANTITFVNSDGARHTAGLTSDAVIARGGRRTAIGDLQSGDRLYVVYDAFTGKIRAVDAVRVDVVGMVISIRRNDRHIWIKQGGSTLQFTVASDAVIVVNGDARALADIRTNDEVTAATVFAGVITYLEVRQR